MRIDLGKEGFRFQTQSDSEVIIYLYSKYGLGFLERLRGEFSFLLLDRERQLLIACRDRFGIKPLYVARTDANGWLFASEAKGLFATGLKKPEIDLWNYSRNENGSLFRGVYNLPPATAYLVDLRNRSFETLTYWTPEFPRESEYDAKKPIEHHLRETDDVFTEAVRLRLRADVPIGLYLSSGIDSALVAAKVRHLTQSRPKAFTVSFTDMKKKYDEGPLSKRIAAQLDVDQVILELDTETLWQNLEECLWHVEHPVGNLAPVAKFMLSSLARQHVKVVLTGEGADEIFLGYRIFRDSLRKTEQRGASRCFSRLIDELRALKGRCMSSLLLMLCVSRKYRKPRCRGAFQCDFPQQSNDRSQIEGRHPVIVLQYRRLKTHLRNVILSAYGDRTEMAHSIEARLPFLDHHLLGVARQIPVRHKMLGNREKHIVREIAKGQVPEELLAKRKWPFSTPRPKLKRGRYKALDRILETYLSREAVFNAAMLKWSGIRVLRVLRKFRSLRRTVDKTLFLVCCLQIIHAFFIEDKSRRLRGERSIDNAGFRP
jgi:asparagine synthase (glutamine-hydrolysing)